MFNQFARDTEGAKCFWSLVYMSVNEDFKLLNLINKTDLMSGTQFGMKACAIRFR